MTALMRPWVAICASCLCAPYWWLGASKGQILRELKRKGWHVSSRRKPLYCPDCKPVSPWPPLARASLPPESGGAR